MSSLEFSASAKDILLNETYRILSSCHNPSNPNSNRTTGLIVGKVQSGKTTSFKTLTMMAMDNGFNLIILLAGRTHNLINQNKDEFIGLNNSIDHKFAVGSVAKLSDWKSVIRANFSRIHGYGSTPNTPLIIITNKHAGHIKKIASELSNLDEDLEKINTLIIDDEADNASLNTAKDKKSHYSASAIYKSIKSLRRSVDKNTVAQYTATPQALLFISKKDHYSPEWARVITPGSNYIGAQELFFEGTPFCRRVPNSEISSVKNIKHLSLPKSFMKAFRSYLLASAQRRDTPNNFHKNNSTFMVHPDIYNVTHEHWRGIIRDEIKLWRSDIDENVNKFLSDNKISFEKEYALLKKACEISSSNISDFETLYEYVPQIIKEVQVIKVNKESNNINWDITHNILIGGYMLDRGYVVRGLVTTYMPRGKGGGMIDSLQQRGRFYGYKRNHLGFIKTWMSQDTIDAYNIYAKHENHLYKTLKKLSDEGKNLREWERIVLLGPGLKPCRKNVMSISLKSDYTTSGGWYFPSYPIHESIHNRDLFKVLINKFKDQFEPYKNKDCDSRDWSNTRKALQARKKNLRDVLDILRYYDPGELDEGKFATVKTILAILKDEGFNATIILTGTSSPNLSEYVDRKRPTMVLPLRSTYFQGRDAKGSYPGERKLIDNSKKSVTIHLTKIVLGSDKGPSYILAIKLPRENYYIEE